MSRGLWRRRIPHQRHWQTGTWREHVSVNSSWPSSSTPPNPTVRISVLWMDPRRVSIRRCPGNPVRQSRAGTVEPSSCSFSTLDEGECCVGPGRLLRNMLMKTTYVPTVLYLGRGGSAGRLEAKSEMADRKDRQRRHEIYVFLHTTCINSNAGLSCAKINRSAARAVVSQ